MKRWPVIRHLRYYWLMWRFAGWLDSCYRLGLGMHPSPSDIDYLNAVWRGQR